MIRGTALNEGSTLSSGQSPMAVPEPALVAIPAGWFSMGCPAGQSVEVPVHRVWVDGFEMAATQVTTGEYALFLDDSRRTPPPFWGEASFSHPRQPVVGVSWFDAMDYCAWLSGRSGMQYRLPAEAEWERAARGGSEGLLYPWGDEPPASRSRYGERWKTGPEPVGESEANAYGLFEMCENVHEWCSDWFDPEYYAASPARNPQGPAEGSRRSSRGGSWRHHVKISRCSARSSIPPEFHYADYGFRVVRGTAASGSAECGEPPLR
ncbi:MAG TPA: SUMF1/EgtB/PvdO family nonheme iron enzyme [Acidobacteriaceae bacterium]|nr:SUMF1/EgtB/PvdO family nonheme iron enzyme [Acidobacteriaceae bacterium]